MWNKMATQSEINERIKKIGAGSFLTKREIQYLPNILWEDETVEKLVESFYEKGQGILVATNKRLVFLDKGRLGGLRVKDFPYDVITSIQYSTGLLMGEITIFSSGDKSTIGNISKQLVANFAEYVRARITPTSQPVTTPAPAPPSAQPQEDMISKLERLGALKDNGIISDKEFEEQKAKILNQQL
jgi:hypothetical protein